MRQDPHAVPYQRASCEQAPALPRRVQRPPLQQASPEQPPYQQVPYQQVPYQQVPYQQVPYQRTPYQQAGFHAPASQQDEPDYLQAEPAYPAPEYPSYGDYDPAPRFPARRSDTRQFRSPRRQGADWDQPVQSHAGWAPEPAEETAALATVREDQRKANRMKKVCLALAIVGLANFLVCLASHQVTTQTELLTPVLILAGLVNYRRYTAKLTRLRAEEASLLGSPC